jgi:hypothetical protein
VTTSNRRRRIVKAHRRRRRGMAPVCLRRWHHHLLCQTERLPAPNRPTDGVFAEDRQMMGEPPSNSSPA